MTLKEAIDALLYLWDHMAPFTGTNALYKATVFMPEYPRGDLTVPKVALSAAGGVNEGKGVGYYERRRTPRLQLDILTTTILDAVRIYEQIRAVTIYDLQHDGTGTAGTVGNGYLHALGLRRVTIGEAREAPWDEAGRVKRLVADVEVVFYDP